MDLGKGNAWWCGELVVIWLCDAAAERLGKKGSEGVEGTRSQLRAFLLTPFIASGLELRGVHVVGDGCMGSLARAILAKI
jgi:hypothetical protein